MAAGPELPDEILLRIVSMAVSSETIFSPQWRRVCSSVSLVSKLFKRELTEERDLNAGAALHVVRMNSCVIRAGVAKPLWREAMVHSPRQTLGQLVFLNEFRIWAELRWNALRPLQAMPPNPGYRANRLVHDMTELNSLSGNMAVWISARTPAGFTVRCVVFLAVGSVALQMVVVEINVPVTYPFALPTDLRVWSFTDKTWRTLQAGDVAFGHLPTPYRISSWLPLTLIDRLDFLRTAGCFLPPGRPAHSSDHMELYRIETLSFGVFTFEPSRDLKRLSQSRPIGRDPRIDLVRETVPKRPTFLVKAPCVDDSGVPRWEVELHDGITVEWLWAKLTTLTKLPAAILKRRRLVVDNSREVPRDVSPAALKRMLMPFRGSSREMSLQGIF